MNFLINLRTFELTEIPDPGDRGGLRFDGKKYVLPSNHAFAMIMPGGVGMNLKEEEFELSPAILLYHPDTPPRRKGYFDLKYLTEALTNEEWTPFFDQLNRQVSVKRICRSWPHGIRNIAAVMTAIRDYLLDHPYHYTQLTFDWVERMEKSFSDIYQLAAA